MNRLLKGALFVSLLVTGFARAGDIGFQAEKLWEGDDKFQWVTVADVDLDKAGDEIVGVTAKGQVIYAVGSGPAPKGKLLWKDPRPKSRMAAVAVGELDAGHVGREIVVAGSLGTVELLHFDTGKRTTLAQAAPSIHDITAGDLSARYAGDEIVVVTNRGHVQVLIRDKKWKVLDVHKDPKRVRDVVIGEFDASHPGLEAMAIGSSGKLFQVYEEGGTWKARTVGKLAKPQARLAAGDVLESSAGAELVSVGDEGSVYLWSCGKKGWKAKQIYRDAKGLRGVAVADVRPDLPGNEILVFGYTRNLTLLHQEKGKWQAQVIWSDTNRAHSLSCGDIDPATTTQECAAVGYSRKLTVVSFQR
jgi:hypothetical protein